MHVRVCGMAGRVVPEIIDAMNGSGPRPAAVTIGDLVLHFGAGAPSPALIRHEDMHREQAARMAPPWLRWAPYRVRVWAGWPAFLRAYVAAHARHGYRDNPFEVEARAAE